MLYEYFVMYCGSAIVNYCHLIDHSFVHPLIQEYVLHHIALISLAILPHTCNAVFEFQILKCFKLPMLLILIVFLF